MREILFRGFQACEHGKQKVFVNGKWIKGKWVYGTLIVFDEDQMFIMPQYNNASSLTYTELFEFFAKPVIPETIGQYTGLTDKNGKKIFEGDIVNIPYVDPIFHMKCNNYDFENGIIKFKSGLFCVNSCDRNYPLYSFTADVEIEVIGNIHDNPELLKGE